MAWPAARAASERDSGLTTTIDQRTGQDFWFLFDDTADSESFDGWSELVLRDAVAESSADSVVRECESLLITVLGTYTSGSQKRMAFQTGPEEWTQVTTADLAPGKVCRRVAVEASRTVGVHPTTGTSHAGPVAVSDAHRYTRN